MFRSNPWLLRIAIISNFIQELFSEFGPLRNATILYNREGRSTGSAELVFMQPEDAREARDQYDGVPLDGAFPCNSLLKYIDEFFS